MLKGALALCAAAFPCFGQAMRTTRVHGLNSSDPSVREVAIAATSQDWPELLIAWNGNYSVSLDAGTTWPTGGLPFVAANTCNPLVPLLQPVDPMVVASPRTGDIYVGAMHFSALARSWSGFSVARKPPHQALLTDRTTIICASTTAPMLVDKGWLTLGSYFGAEVLFLGYGAAPTSPDCSTYRVYGRMSSPEFLPGRQWLRPSYPISDSVTCGDPGNGVANAATNAPGVGPLLFSAWNPSLDNANTISRPVARWSSNYGEPTGSQSSWQGPQITFDQVASQGERTGEAILQTVPRGVVAGTFRLQNFPAVAVNPNNPAEVYTVFCGATESTGADNLGLIVSKSEDGGRTFSGANTLHLTQSLLQAPGNSDQCFPAITVDASGGVNILWYQVTPYADPTDQSRVVARVGWCRIASFTLPLPAPPKVRYLTPPWLPKFLEGSGESIGDYIGICSTGCFVFCGYMSCHENGWPNIYCTRLDLCTADADTNGVVDPADLLAFAKSYAAGAAGADVTDDGHVDGSDLLAFQEAYASGCGSR